MVIKKFDIPIYDKDFCLVVFDEAEIPLVIKKFNCKDYPLSEDELDGRAASTNTKYGYTIFIKTTEDQSIIAHEVIHIKNAIFSETGVVMDYDNDEHEANLVEFLFRTASKYVKPVEHKTRKKKNESI